MQPDKNADCGKCGSPIPGELNACPQCDVQPSRKGAAAPVFLVILVLLSSLLMLGSSVVNVASVPMAKVESKESTKEESAPSDMKLAAYEAAKQFVTKRHPGLKNFSDFNGSPIEPKGNQYTVSFSADDFSVSSNPARNFFNVELEYVSGEWKLLEIKQ